MSQVGLFDRLPRDLFGPLASQNPERYWNLLLRLYDRFFGPEAAPPDGEGYLQRAITMEIERHILDTPNWAPEASEDPATTPLSVQSNLTYRYFVNSGWLREDRIGARHFVTMPTIVQRFLELLRQFAEEGPPLLAGKIQLIYNQLRQVVLDPAKQATGFHEAALQSRQMVASLSATTMRVRDIMDSLRAQDSTADYIRTYFEQYITDLYIADYHSLRTENHPLRHRWEIIQWAMDLRDDPDKRKVLVTYYQTAFRCQGVGEAEERFEQDVARLLMLKDIDSHLDRLNASVDRATTRALAYLHYKLRTPDRIDQLLTGSIGDLTRSATEDIRSMGMFTAVLMGEKRFPTPSRKEAPPARTVMKRRVVTPEELAHRQLRRIMNANRNVTPNLVADYLDRHLQTTGAVCSDDLPVVTINDFCLFVVATRMALISRHPKGAARQAHPMLVGLRKYRFECNPGWTDNAYLRVPRFTVTKRREGDLHV
jgi:hypothetical protein